MAAKTQKVETNEEFIRAWHEETSLWDVCSSHYKDRNAKRKSWNTLGEIFDMTGKQLFY